MVSEPTLCAQATTWHIVGGLLVSQLLPPITTPVVYVYMDRLNVWLGRGLRAGGRRQGANRVTRDLRHMMRLPPMGYPDLWEFGLCAGDGTPFAQSLVAEGVDEESAAACAAVMIDVGSGAVLARPGIAIGADAAMRWREVVAAFPALVSDVGRLARYARGLPAAGASPRNEDAKPQ
jgi:hypothetical protein